MTLGYLLPLVPVRGWRSDAEAISDVLIGEIVSPAPKRLPVLMVTPQLEAKPTRET